MSRVTIEDYTPKSFVVRGETQPHKESLKSMGGKWNTMLTDKQTGQKFGAWLFWADKRAEIQEWYDNGMPAFGETVIVHKSETRQTGNIELRLERIEKMLQQILELQGSSFNPVQPTQNNNQTESQNVDIYEEPEEETTAPVRRLMSPGTTKVSRKLV